MKAVEVVAAALECDPVEVPRPYDAVDPDALDVLVRQAGVTDGEEVAVTVEHAGRLVTVEAGGRVTVDPDT